MSEDAPQNQKSSVAIADTSLITPRPRIKSNRRAAAAAAAAATNAAGSTESGSFVSPRRKRAAHAVVTATKSTKKARQMNENDLSHLDCKPTASTSHRYPLRSRAKLCGAQKNRNDSSTRGSTAASTSKATSRGSTKANSSISPKPTNQPKDRYARSNSNDTTVAVVNAALPQAVTPASAREAREAVRRNLQFNEHGVAEVPPFVVPLYAAKGNPNCTCPKHCSYRDLLSFEHLRNYGQNQIGLMLERERLEYAYLNDASIQPPGSNHGSKSKSSSSETTTISGSPDSRQSNGSSSSGEKEDADDHSDSDDEQEEKSESSYCSPLTSSPPSTSDSPESAVETPTTPYPTTIIMTKARTRFGNKSMRFLEQPSKLLVRQPFITERMRAILVSWLVEVSIEYNCSTAAYHLAVSLLDRVLDGGPTPAQCAAWSGWEEAQEQNNDEEEFHESDWPKSWFVVTRQDFQALGCACLWIASKMEDRDPPVIEDFQYISDHSVSSLCLRRMERRVCNFLQFRLHCLSPMDFVPTFLRAGRECIDACCPYQSPVMYHLVLYLVTLGRLSYKLSRYLPSILTSASVYLARATLAMRDDDMYNEHGPFWTENLAHYTGYEKEDLKHPVLALYHYHLKAEEMNVAVYQQFSKPKFDCVSKRTVPRLEELGWWVPVEYDFLTTEE